MAKHKTPPPLILLDPPTQNNALQTFYDIVTVPSQSATSLQVPRRRYKMSHSSDEESFSSGSEPRPGQLTRRDTVDSLDRLESGVVTPPTVNANVPSSDATTTTWATSLTWTHHTFVKPFTTSLSRRDSPQSDMWFCIYQLGRLYIFWQAVMHFGDLIRGCPTKDQDQNQITDQSIEKLAAALISALSMRVWDIIEALVDTLLTEEQNNA